LRRANDARHVISVESTTVPTGQRRGRFQAAFSGKEQSIEMLIRKAAVPVIMILYLLAPSIIAFLKTLSDGYFER